MNLTYSVAAMVAAIAIASSANAATQTLQITDVFSEIVGTTPVISGSGSAANTDTFAINDNARFELSVDDGTTGASATRYGLDVSIVGATGALQPGTDGLMVARTQDSQGFTDTGTLSIYFRPTSDTDWTGTLRFSLFDETFTTPTALDVNITSLDIDFRQRVSVEETSIASYGLAPNSRLSANASAGRLTFSDSGTNAQFSDPLNAFRLGYEDTSSFDVTFEHDAVALYVFEFRTPSEAVDDRNFVDVRVAPIPVPASLPLLLAGLGGLGFVARRRRRS